MIDLSDWCKENGLRLTDSVIFYKGLQIAGYFNGWWRVSYRHFVDKRLFKYAYKNGYLLRAIIPLCKIHGYFLKSDMSLTNHSYNIKGAVLHKEDDENFRESLIIARDILEKRYQILKGKCTMLRKHMDENRPKN